MNPVKDYLGPTDTRSCFGRRYQLRSLTVKPIIALLFVLALTSLPTFAQKITIDYAHDFDFDTIETFQYVDTPDTNTDDQLMDGRIKDAIIRRLAEGRLKQVESDGDILVTYHIATKDNVVFNTTSTGWGGARGPGWGGWGGGMGGWGGGMGMSSSTTTASTYTEGTIAVDAYEPTGEQMIWRGTGTVTIKAKPEKRAQQIEKIMDKMGARWDKILANRGK